MHLPRRLLLALLLPLAACGSGEAPGFSYDGPVASADWTTTPAAYRGQDGQHVAYQCPKNPGGQGGSLWGSDEYTDDSSVCMAGVHAGVITFRDGGQVVIEIRPGRPRYAGTTAHGVTSDDWGSWDGGFVVMR